MCSHSTSLFTRSILAFFARATLYCSVSPGMEKRKQVLGVAASSNLHPCNVVGEVRVNTFTVEQLEV